VRPHESRTWLVEAARLLQKIPDSSRSCERALNSSLPPCKYTITGTKLSCTFGPGAAAPHAVRKQVVW
jgi:hypothetical protein